MKLMTCQIMLKCVKTHESRLLLGNKGTWPIIFREHGTAWEGLLNGIALHASRQCLISYYHSNTLTFVFLLVYILLICSKTKVSIGVNILIFLFYICPPEVHRCTSIPSILQFFHEHRIQVDFFLLLLFYIVFFFFLFHIVSLFI